MPAERETLQHDLKEARENLALIDERIADYVLSTDVPLQLIKEQRRLKSRIRQIERRLAGQRPIEVLRRVTKLMTGPLAETLTGAPWRALRQRLLTQASRLPRQDYLDGALLEAVTDDLAHLAHEVQVLLEARRIEPDPAQLEGLCRRAGQLAGLLLRIYRLKPGDTPELDSLAAEPQPVTCPYCSHAYVPAETNYACPNCGAATPQDLLPQGTGSGDVSQNAPEN